MMGFSPIQRLAGARSQSLDGWNTAASGIAGAGLPSAADMQIEGTQLKK